MRKNLVRFLSDPNHESARFSRFEHQWHQTHISGLSIGGTAIYKKRSGGAGRNRTDA